MATPRCENKTISAAASLTLGSLSARGVHPALRLDHHLRSTDAGYQHGEQQTHGDRFVRKMATYGQVRPSVSFTNESRAARPFKEGTAIDMSNLPPTWLDPSGDPRELTLDLGTAPTEIDESHVAKYKNHDLMLPSERYREHVAMKRGEKKWREDREKLAFHTKGKKVLQNRYPQGILGIDGPMHPGTQLFAEQRGFLEAQADARSRQSEARFEYLHSKKLTSDATKGLDFDDSCSGLVERSLELPLQRKRVDPVAHPARFMNTHERLFPTFAPSWDPDRAKVLRGHDVRDKKHNFLCSEDNALTYNVASHLGLAP